MRARRSGTTRAGWRGLSDPEGSVPVLEQRLTFVTLGWTPLLDAAEAVFFQVGRGLVLSLYGRTDLDGYGPDRV